VRLIERLAASNRLPDESDMPHELIADISVASTALRRLRPWDREALCLIAWDGLDDKQASEVVGCSLSAFKVRLHRARKRLEKELADLDRTASFEANRIYQRSSHDTSAKNREVI
jgi:RNA polymerase sigma-70 factor (ECF subfamily)